MTTPEICSNCTYSQWVGSSLTCTNEQSDEHLMFVLGLNKCNEFERYAGAGDGDNSEDMGAIE